MDVIINTPFRYHTVTHHPIFHALEADILLINLLCCKSITELLWFHTLINFFGQIHALFFMAQWIYADIWRMINLFFVEERR